MFLILRQVPRRSRAAHDARNPINTGISSTCAADFGVSVPIPYAPYSTRNYKGLHGVTSAPCNTDATRRAPVVRRSSRIRALAIG